MLEASTDDGNDLILLKFETYGSAKRSDANKVPFALFLVANSTFKTFFFFSPLLFVRRWCRLRFCALHIFLLCAHLIRSLIWCDSRLIPKLLLRPLRQGFWVLYSLRRKYLRMIIWKEWALLSTMWLFQTHPTKGNWIEINPTGSVRTRRSQHGCRWQAGSDLHHDCNIFCQLSRSCLGIASIFDIFGRTWSISLPTTAVPRVSTMIGPFLELTSLSYCSACSYVMWRARLHRVAHRCLLQYDRRLRRTNSWSPSMNIPFNTYSSKIRLRQDKLFTSASAVWVGGTAVGCVSRANMTSVLAMTSSVLYVWKR